MATVIRFRAPIEKPEGALYGCPECGDIFSGGYNESGLKTCVCGAEAVMIAKIAKMIKPADDGKGSLTW